MVESRHLRANELAADSDLRLSKAEGRQNVGLENVSNFDDRHGPFEPDRGCLVGTFWGVRLLQRIPAQRYKQALSLLICALGAYMILKTKLD